MPPETAVPDAREFPDRVLTIRRTLVRAMIEEARAAAPHEYIALIGGSGDRIAVTHRPLRNIASDPEKRFLADPYEQFQAERAFKQAGLLKIGICHSHPGGGVGLSDDDLRNIRSGSLVQMILAFDPRSAPGAERLGAFVLREGRPTRLPIKYV